ncbi:lipoyl synthase [Candidatus Woesearchaeota archaeon]|nr:lipoyl synthase [Candidatus Woesearchaeota archaeon]
MRLQIATAASNAANSAHVYGGKPEWLKIRPPTETFTELRQLISHFGLHTVCEEAHCPNMSECWSGGTATFMVLGDTCTRGCKFCAVKTGNPKGAVSNAEPLMLARCVKEMNALNGGGSGSQKMDYIVITSVDRDDLPDQGASHFARCIAEVKKANPGIMVEVLTPDFRGSVECVKTIVDANPDVFDHNIETVRRLQRKVRDPRAGYEQSLSVLAAVKDINPGIFTKSSVMLGLGETEDEVVEAMRDLRGIDVDILTLGQYLRPSGWHLAVAEYVAPERFNKLKLLGEGLGFKYVAAGPFVRSSYRAGELFVKNVLKRQQKGEGEPL